ncbi:MAG TPA: DUF6496 domain-containing protein [Bryobacteraceae bacterium]|nr:DUF6496 domain-containing protein [Bryobacteraceae bacterium]
MAPRKTSRKAQKKVGKVMHEYKHGQLKSGGRKKVKNRKQAIAIALSEARRSGAKVAPKKGAKKSASKKKASSRKQSSSKKSTSKRKSTKKSSRKS